MKQLYFFLLFLVISEMSFSQNTCGTAVQITVPYNSGSLTTCGSGNDYIQGSYCSAGAGYGEDYVFSLQVTNAPVVYNIALTGGNNLDLVASIHTACPPTSSNAIGCVEAQLINGYSGNANIQFPSNGTYYIIIDSWYGSVSCSQFTLNVTVPSNLAPNDNCATATTVMASSDLTCRNSISSSTINASSNPNAPGSCFGNADDEVWFKFVATATAHTIDFYGLPANASMVQQIYSGDCNNLTQMKCYGESKTVTHGFVPGQTYYIRAYTHGSEAANFNLCIYGVPPKPSNDECSGAIELTPSSQNYCTTPVKGTTYGATESPSSLPLCGSGGGNNDDVWYSFVATNDTHIVRLTNLTAWSSIAVYSGTCGSLTQLTCADELVGVTGLTPGTRYYVRVYTSTYASATAADFEICVSVPATNDHCVNATTLQVSSNNVCTNAVRGTTAGTNASGETAPSCNAVGVNDDQWFKFTASATTHTVSVSRLDITGLLGSGVISVAAYSGSCGALTQLPGACATSSEGGLNLTSLTIGTTYYLRVYTPDVGSGPGDFEICVGVAPVHNDCAGAITLTTSSSTPVRGSTVGSTQSPQASHTACIDNAHNDDVWYKFTATSSSHIIAVTETSTPTVAAVYSGDCSGGLNLMAGGCAEGGVTMNGLTPGQIYYVRVYSSSTSANVYTNFNINIPAAAPANDECSNAITINGVTSSTNVGATQSMAPQACGPLSNMPAKDVWFKFVANSAGSVRIEVTNLAIDFDPVLLVYSGTCGNFTIIGCSDGGGKNLSEATTVYGLTAGTTYYARVYSFDGVPGAFDINVYGAALPVELISFTGTRVNNQNIIRWTTASEKNNAGFELQSSTDAVTFKPVAFIATKSSNGFSSTQLHYEYTDIISGGTVWYRLKQVDKDGKAWYSNILTIRGENVKGFTLATFPNPSQGNITLKTVTDKAVAGTIVIRDLTGRKMMEQQVTLTRGESHITLPTGKLPAGTYILQVTSTEGVLQGIMKIVRL